MKIENIPFPYKYSTRNKSKTEQTSIASKYPQGYFKDKPCKRCLKLFKPNAPSEHYCNDTCKDEGLSNTYLLREYNISLDEYRELYIKQNGKCAICETEGFKMNLSKTNNEVKLNLDHCHTTNKVRGLLCHNCNRALGLLKDNPEYLQKAIYYLNGNV